MKNLVESHPEGKTYFSEANGAISLSSSPRAAGRCPVSSHSRTHGGCPRKFPGASALFWDRVRLVTKLSCNTTGCMRSLARLATLKSTLNAEQKIWFLVSLTFACSHTMTQRSWTCSEHMVVYTSNRFYADDPNHLPM